MPNQSGWYWMKRQVRTATSWLNTGPCLVFIDDKLGLPGFGGDEMTVREFSEASHDIWWAGPIPEPMELNEHA